jgi:hypothetical protein
MLPDFSSMLPEMSMTKTTVPPPNPQPKKEAGGPAWASASAQARGRAGGAGGVGYGAGCRAGRPTGLADDVGGGVEDGRGTGCAGYQVSLPGDACGADAALQRKVSVAEWNSPRGSFQARANSKISRPWSSTDAAIHPGHRLPNSRMWDGN